MDFDVAMTVLRVAAGAIFFAHGMQKLAGWFGGTGLAGTEQMMASLGLHPPRLQATMAALAETGAGVLLLTGLLMPLAALLACSVMLTAILTVHIKNGLFASNGGYELNLALIAPALALACVGPGWLSLDNLVGITWSSWRWALVALIVAAAGAVGTVTLARRPLPPD